MGSIQSRIGNSKVPALEEADLWARHLLVCFLQALFAKLPLEDDYHWEPELDATRIVILGGTAIDFGRVNTRPLISVDIQGYQPLNLSMDQMRYSNLINGERRHMDMVMGSAVIHVLAKVETEARRLGGFVMRQIRYHRRMLQKEGGFAQIGLQLQVGPPSPPGSIFPGYPDDDGRLVSISLPWHLVWSWYARPVAPQEQVTLQAILTDRPAEYERPPLVRVEEINMIADIAEVVEQTAGLNVGPKKPE